ncbi:MAG: hypothetical protein ACJ76V_00930 [Thermoleophilaceae bacterium]
MRRLRLAGGGASRDGAPGRAAAMTAAMGRGGRRMLNTLANLVRLTAGLVALVIVIGIAFVLLKANRDNSIVNAVNDAASWLTQPFHNMFNPKNHRTEIVVNWGLAALVYVIAGNLIARLLRR